MPRLFASCLTVAGLMGLGLCAPACQRTETAPSVFGGQGAQVGSADEQPLPEGAGKPEALGPCGKVRPASDAQLIDDFEDGNDRIFKGFERDGFWFSASDKTEGSTVTPFAPFAPELLAPAESSKENRYAAHLTAAGETNWAWCGEPP